LRDRTIACPSGQVQRFAFGTIVEFDPDVCDHCALRDQCTTAELGHGRSVAIAENEPLQHRLRKQIQTPAGRAALRERTMIEHKLAHISQRQGPAMTALAQTPAKAVRRLAVVYHPNGVVYENWVPKGIGAGFELSPILAPLERFRNQLVVVTGLASRPAEALGDGGGDHSR